MFELFMAALAGYFLVGCILTVVIFYDYCDLENLLESLECVSLWPVFLVCALFVALEDNCKPKTVLCGLAAILVLVIIFYIAQVVLAH